MRFSRAFVIKIHLFINLFMHLNFKPFYGADKQGGAKKTIINNNIHI